MILAAPLVIPFAEAVGISIASLGMAKAADMVNEYIQENPEQSVKILSTIVPNVGIGQIFANKEDSDDEEVEEDTRSKKEIVLGELAKDKGNYSDEDAEGKYSSKRGRIIRALEDAGKVNPDREYNPEKKYQGYKRFLKKADGGAIGIEVLFGPKRQELFMGGPALTGQPLAIYNSMKAYQSFTDQEIADAIKQAGYDLPTADSGTTTPPDSTPGSSQPSGNNDGRSAPSVGSVAGGGSGLIGDYMTATQERQNRLTNPNVPTSFISSLTGGGQRDIGEMIRSGEVDTRKSSGIPLGIGSAIARMMPDKYYDMSLADQVFTQSQMGYTGPTVFGENSMGNKDPFGLNVRSGFGNYAEAVGENFNQLRDTLTKDRAGVTFNEETGMFEGINADAVNKQTEMIRNKYNFRKQQLGVKNLLDSRIKAADDQREKDRLAAEAKAIAQEKANRDYIKEEAKKAAAKKLAVAQEKANRDYIKEEAKKAAAKKLAVAQEKANRDYIKEEAKKAAAKKSAVAQEKSNRDAVREEAKKAAAKKSAVAQEKSNRDAVREEAKKAAAKKSAVAQEKSNRDAARDAARDRAATRSRDLGSGPPGIGGGGGGGGGCFLKGTLITMLDGTRKPVEQVDLGDEVAVGGKVFAVGRFLNTELYDYKGIKVSGSHMVNEDGTWMRVRDTKHGKSLGDDQNTVYVFGSENRRILINDILFTDYFEVNEQDILMEDSEDFFNNSKNYGKIIDEQNVDILNAS